MEYGPGDSEKYHRRLRKQKGYQRDHRDMQAEDGIPERDDVASVVLAGILTQCVQNPSLVENFVATTAERLTRVKKQFDKDMSAEVLRNMIERHRQQMDRDARRRAAGRRRET